MTKVAFLGLGAMGSAMVPNLLKAGFAVAVHNRTREKAAPLLHLGATWAESPAQAARGAGFAVTMLSDDSALSGVCRGPEGLLEGLGAGVPHLSMSTVSPLLVEALAEEHRRRGSVLLGSPVFGRPDAAAAARLWICLSGPAEARRRAMPPLQAMGQKVFEFGEDPAAAHLVKLCGNFLLASAVEAMSEAFVLGQKRGIPRASLHELFSSTIFPGPVHQGYGARVAGDAHQPAGFKLSLGLKDVSLALAEARRAEVPMPMASLCANQLLAGLAKGRGEMDLSALVLEAADNAGLGGA